MDQAECAGGFAIARQRRMQPVPHAEQHVALGGGEYRVVPERAPERFGSHQPVGIERVAPEPGRRCPAGRLVVHGRHNGAKALEVAGVRGAVRFTCDHIAQQFAFHPAREAGPAPFPGGGDLDLGEALARLRQQRFGGRDASLDQGAGPKMLGSQGHDVVVPGAVQPQHERRPVACIGCAEGDVLAQVHEVQIGGLDAERDQCLPGGRRIGLRSLRGHVWLRAPARRSIMMGGLDPSIMPRVRRSLRPRRPGIRPRRPGRTAAVGGSSPRWRRRRHCSSESPCPSTG